MLQLTNIDNIDINKPAPNDDGCLIWTNWKNDSIETGNINAAHRQQMRKYNI